MDISDQGEKIVVFIAQNGLVAIFEQVSRALMPPVEVNRVPGEQLSHDRRYPLLPAFKKDMDMIAHEDPGVDRAFRFNNVLSQSLEEFIPVLIVAEYIRFVVPAHHDVMQRTGDI